MKSLMCQLLDILHECGMNCGVSVTRDVKTITRRFEDEGLSFLTITLPSFCSAFQQSLDRGHLRLSDFNGFKKSSRSGRLPAFLQGFVRLVFDPRSGHLVDVPCPESIRSIRQITLLLSKVNLPCSERRIRDAFQTYINCERELSHAETAWSKDVLDSFFQASSMIFGNVFDSLNLKVENLSLVPKHGPGATADRKQGNLKFHQVVWHQRLEEYFPSVDYILPSPRYWKHLDKVEFSEPGAELPSRVISVPKTLKTPRIIAIEPTCMQYTQQALLRPLVDLLEGSDSPSRGFIGITSQSLSREMAKKASSDGSLATLDLSEASDRVSNLLVKTMLRAWPALSGAVQACRSVRADVPGHGIIPLTKFASMGSALCFPFEAMVFATCALLAVTELKRPVTDKDISSLAGRMRIYGDDIIIPTYLAPSMLRILELFALKVNRGKSFWNGKFRETCGGEYYDGHDVSVVKIRQVLPSSIESTTEVVSAVSYRNQLYKAGLWSTARKMDRYLRKLLPAYPTVHDTSPVLGRHTFLDYQVDKMCPKLHRPLVKGLVVQAKPRKSHLSGIGALVKFHLKESSLPLQDGHLMYSGRPVAVRTKLRWTPPF